MAKNDVEIIKKILLKLFGKTDSGLIFIHTYFIDSELIELLKELGEK